MFCVISTNHRTIGSWAFRISSPAYSAREGATIRLTTFHCTWRVSIFEDLIKGVYYAQGSYRDESKANAFTQYQQFCLSSRVVTLHFRTQGSIAQIGVRNMSMRRHLYVSFNVEPYSLGMYPAHVLREEIRCER